MSELEWTCENCKYDDEDMEGAHCRHCIHNAEEHFEPKENEMTATEMKNNVIDEFAKRLKDIEQIAIKCTRSQSDGYSQIMRICDEMKGVQSNDL